MLTPIQIERVRPADVNELLELSYQTFYDAFFIPFNSAEDFEAYTSSAFNVEKLLSEINNPNSIFYFALVGDEKVGFIKLNYSSAQTELQDENAVEVERIYVLQTYQGKKIGNQLLDFAIAKAVEAKLQYIWLGVWEHNTDAQRFYDRAGFVKFGSHDFWVGNDKQTDFLVKKELL
ncbi:MAG TPA: GNAT family N-acetyltransferase [Mucilaginibacter sp.]